MTQQKINQQRGFTLVELAIVLTIVGLLIGGVLKGQQLMTNARITSTIAQVKAIESAVTTFRDTYNGLPGDITNGNTRIPGCNTACDQTGSTEAGNGIVGSTTWNLTAFQSASIANAANATAAGETVLFWFQLAQAGLLSGVTSDGVNSIAASFGGSLPAARIGGGFVVGYSNGITNEVGGQPVTITGTVLALLPAPAAATATAATGAITPAIGGQIDRKMDDGVGSSGDVQSYGLSASCRVGTPLSYLESVTSKDCGLFIRIQG